jgi:maleylpyruvate isomerase
VSDDVVNQHEIDRDRSASIASEHALVEHLRTIEPFDPATPSQLPDWTLGHVLTHIARNADSIVSMLDGHPQYPHGREGRNADIEAGSTRSWAELIDDVETSSDSLVVRWAGVADWSGVATTIGGERPLAMVPLLRQREVEVHRADLGLGYGFGDMPTEYIRKELRLMNMLWKARKPMGMTPLPEAALAAPPPLRLAWMMGRAEIDGVGPAGLL